MSSEVAHKDREEHHPSDDADHHGDYIPSTKHASAYQFMAIFPQTGILTHSDLHLLRHVNCSYLSSGRSPTLVELKQHAQSLCNLIRKLCLSEAFGHTVARDSDDFAFDENDALDFLNDLDTPYENADESHNVPLGNLRNNLMESDRGHTKIRCPWTEVSTEEGVELPYLHHQSLLEHANECLETLDNEFAETGGILSILPRGDESNGEEPELANIRNSFIGQWLLHYQHLVARTHELEINHLHALDLLAGEANVPLQLAATPEKPLDKTSVGDSQHRFILVNAGADVVSSLHDLLDKEEAERIRRESQWRRSGVSGDRFQRQAPNGDTYSAGLVSVEVKSRFYRHAGAGRTSPIFIVPAYGIHPGVEYTRQAEKCPATIVLPSREIMPFPNLPSKEQWHRNTGIYVDEEDEGMHQN